MVDRADIPRLSRGSATKGRKTEASKILGNTAGKVQLSGSQKLFYRVNYGGKGNPKTPPPPNTKKNWWWSRTMGGKTKNGLAIKLGKEGIRELSRSIGRPPPYREKPISTVISRATP